MCIVCARHSGGVDRVGGPNKKKSLPLFPTSPPPPVPHRRDWRSTVKSGCEPLTKTTAAGWVPLDKKSDLFFCSFFVRFSKKNEPEKLFYAALFHFPSLLFFLSNRTK